MDKEEQEKVVDVLRDVFDPAYGQRKRKKARFQLLEDLQETIDYVEGVGCDHPDWESWVFWQRDDASIQRIVVVDEEGFRQFTVVNEEKTEAIFFDASKLKFVEDKYYFSKSVDPETNEPNADGSALEFLARALGRALA